MKGLAALARRASQARNALVVRGGGGGPMARPDPPSQPLAEQDELIWDDGTVNPEPALDEFNLVSKQTALKMARAVTLLRQQLGPNYPRIYPVHRLDAMTSGAMMFAKSPDIVREIIQKFKAKQVSKYYVAISARKPSKKMGSVVGDMTRGRRGSWMLQRTTETSPAVTRFIASAVPGRPVLGDIRYGNALGAGKEPRGCLHCAALRLYIGDTLHQVVCPPWLNTPAVFPPPPQIPGESEEDTNPIDNNMIDSEFKSSGFQQLFEEKWFSPGIEDNMGIWFPENKLLRSTPESLL
ncbi:hypothetical protein Ndes2437A_g01365 [Nannochloris sp. 'desiccata']